MGELVRDLGSRGSGRAYHTYTPYQTNLELVDHANKLGIRLKSSNAFPVKGTRKRTLSPRSMPAASRVGSAKSVFSQRAKSSTSRFSPRNTSDVQYIQNVVVPLNAPADEQNVQLSTAPHSFSSRTRPNLPHMRSPRRQGPAGKTFLTSLSASPYSERYSDRHSDRHLDRFSSSASALDFHDEDAPAWRNNEQVLRFENEVDNTVRSRCLKRTSEIRSHRVDRMYYMSGNSLSIKPRYQVDEEELARLRELSRSRAESRRSSTAPHARNRTSWAIVKGSKSTFTPLYQELKKLTFITPNKFLQGMLPQRRKSVRYCFDEDKPNSASEGTCGDWRNVNDKQDIKEPGIVKAYEKEGSLCIPFLHGVGSLCVRMPTEMHYGSQALCPASLGHPSHHSLKT